MKKFLVIALIATAAATSRGMFFEEGTKEISVAGLLDFESANGTRADLNLFYGYFFMDYLEIGLAGSYLNDDAVRVWALGPHGEWNFDIGLELVPFVGGSLMYAHTRNKNLDENRDAGIAGLQGGAKYMLTEYAALSAALVFEAATDDIYPESDDKTSSTDVRAELGMRIFF